jgi:pimeloyl-ACP methyl ester carboxylesterase
VTTGFWEWTASGDEDHPASGALVGERDFSDGSGRYLWADRDKVHEKYMGLGMTHAVVDEMMAGLQPAAFEDRRYTRDRPVRIAVTEMVRDPNKPSGTPQLVTKVENILDSPHRNDIEAGPVWIMIHGVPMNRTKKYEVMLQMSKFCRCYAIDLLGMGESDMPVGFDQHWSWSLHAEYIKEFVNEMFPDQKVFLQGDDWGAGPVLWAASDPGFTQQKLHATVLVNPIWSSGYFIPEVKVFGTLNVLNKANWESNRQTADNPQLSPEFRAQAELFPLFFTTVTKGMSAQGFTGSPTGGITDQWVARSADSTYFDADYERNIMHEGVGIGKTPSTHPDSTLFMNSLSMRIHHQELLVLAEQASFLRPVALQPFHSTKNPAGVKYSQIGGRVKVIWGRQDNMMPANQAQVMQKALGRAYVDVTYVDAGHFVESDKPVDVAEIQLNYTIALLGDEVLAQPFLGFQGNFKGDEREKALKLKELLQTQK